MIRETITAGTCCHTCRFSHKNPFDHMVRTIYCLKIGEPPDFELLDDVPYNWNENNKAIIWIQCSYVESWQICPFYEPKE